MRRAVFVTLSFLLASGAASGQDAVDCDELKAAEIETCPVPGDADEAVVHDTRPQIRVLEHPYDLASFYRADGRRPGFYERAGARYPIAGYYRGAVNPRGYSRFWTSGYGPRTRTLAVVPYTGYEAVPSLDYWSRIGENGDLFLMAPILAPIGPLSDVFFSVEIR